MIFYSNNNWHAKKPILNFKLFTYYASYNDFEKLVWLWVVLRFHFRIRKRSCFHCKPPATGWTHQPIPFQWMDGWFLGSISGISAKVLLLWRFLSLYSEYSSNWLSFHCFGKRDIWNLWLRCWICFASFGYCCLGLRCYPRLN